MTRPAVGTLIPLLRGGGGGVELPERWNQIVTARALDDISVGDPVTLSYVRPSWGANLGPAPIDLSSLVDIGEYKAGSLSASADFRYFVHVNSKNSPRVSFYEMDGGILNKMDFPAIDFLWLKMDKTGRYMVGKQGKDPTLNTGFVVVRRDGTSFKTFDLSYLGKDKVMGRPNVAFSSDSKYLLVVSFGYVSVHYNLATSEDSLPGSSVNVFPNTAISAEWMPDSRVFFVGCWNAPFIYVFLLTDAHQIEEVTVTGLNVSSSVRKIAWSNDARFIACELGPTDLDARSTSIEIFKHDGNLNFEKVATLDTDSHLYRETSILFTPDSNFFIAGRRIYEITPEDEFVLTQQEYIENIPIPSSSYRIHDILVKDDMSLIVYTRPGDAEYPLVFGPAASPENVFQRLVSKDDLRRIDSSNQLGVALDTTQAGASGRLVVFSKLNEVT